MFIPKIDKKFVHPQRRPKDFNFQPSAHGSLVKLIDKPSQISKVKPESPRPPEMLTGLKIHGDKSLSAMDMSLHEMLISYAYEIDSDMTQECYRIPTKALCRFLGPSVSRDDLMSSVSKMRDIMIDYVDSDDPNRRFADVNLIYTWREFNRDDEYLAYTWTLPVRKLMRTMSSYAYLELVAIGNGGMSLKYSPLLYKALLAKTIGVRWAPGQTNEIEVMLTPIKLAQLIGFPGNEDENKINIGKLTAFVTDSLADLKRVSRFSTDVEIIRAEGRGRKVKAFKYTLKINPPDYRQVPVRIDFTKKQFIRRGGADDPMFIVRSDLWDRAKALNGGPAGPFHHKNAFNLWLVAINEALDEKPLTDGYSERAFRGQNLLEAIETNGADFAAWGLLCEEAEDNDLISYLSDRSNAPLAIKIEAEASRRQRIGWKTSKLEGRAARSRKEVEWTKRAPTTEERIQQYLDERAEFEKAKQLEIDIAKAMNDKPYAKDMYTIISTGEEVEWSEIEAVLTRYTKGNGKRRSISVVDDFEDMTLAIKATDEELKIIFDEISKFYNFTGQ